MFLHDVLKNPVEIRGWVNGNLYVPTSERMGILPIPEDVWHSSGMAKFSPVLNDQKQAHRYLAQKQGTRKAILPVHTPTEIDLFRHLMEANPAFNSTSSGPIWKLAVKVWNEIADREDGVFYKVRITTQSKGRQLISSHRQLVEQLKVYYSTWQTNLNVRQSLSMTSAARHPVVAAARDPLRSQAVPTHATRPLKPHCVTKGLDTSSLACRDSPTGPVAFEHSPLLPAHPSLWPLVQPSLVPASTSSEMLAMDIDGPQPEVATAMGQVEATGLNPCPPTVHNTVMALVGQRVTSSIENTKAHSKWALAKLRKPRSCAKCGIVTCPGQQIRFNCRQPCQDCGQHGCIGCNTKRLEKNCRSGWENCEETKPQGVFKFRTGP